MSDESTSEAVAVPETPEFDVSDGSAAFDAAFAAFAGSQAVEVPEEAPEAAEEPAEAVAESQEAPQAAPEPPQPPPAPEQPSDAEQRLMERIAAKEREMRTMLERERAQLEAQQTELRTAQERIREWEEFERRLSEEDVLGALQSRGWKLEDLARAALDGRGAAPMRRMETELQRTKRELEERIQAMERSRQEQEQQAFQAALYQEADQEVAARSPVLSAAGSYGRNIVLSLAEEYARQGNPVTYDTLVPEAERSLAQLIESVLRVPENRSRFLGESSPSQSQQAKPAPTTLSGSVASQASSRRTARPNIDDLPKEAAIEALFESGGFLR